MYIHRCVCVCVCVRARLCVTTTCIITLRSQELEANKLRHCVRQLLEENGGKRAEDLGSSLLWPNIACEIAQIAIVSVRICMRVCTRTCTHACMHACTHAWMLVCVHACVYTRTSIIFGSASKTSLPYDGSAGRQQRKTRR